MIYHPKKYISAIFTRNKRRLSCAKLSPQSTSLLGPMALSFGWFELLNSWSAELLDYSMFNCWIIGLLHCYIFILLNYGIFELLMCWVIELLNCWSVEWLNCWIDGLLNWWNVRLMNWLNWWSVKCLIVELLNHGIVFMC